MIYTVLNTYTYKDGREIAYVIDNGKKRVISYPRVLMAEKIGRKLEPYEDVHHIDEDVRNNDISNLQLVLHGEHQKEHMKKNIKYFDKVMICSECGKEFLWTALQQRMRYSNLSRKIQRNKYSVNHGGPFCSKKCAGKYSRRIQLKHSSHMPP